MPKKKEPKCEYGCGKTGKRFEYVSACDDCFKEYGNPRPPGFGLGGERVWPVHYGSKLIPSPVII